MTGRQSWRRVGDGRALRKVQQHPVHACLHFQAHHPLPVRIAVQVPLPCPRQRQGEPNTVHRRFGREQMMGNATPEHCHATDRNFQNAAALQVAQWLALPHKIHLQIRVDVRGRHGGRTADAPDLQATCRFLFKHFAGHGVTIPEKICPCEEELTDFRWQDPWMTSRTVQFQTLPNIAIVGAARR